MKNKLTLSFSTFTMICCFFLLVVNTSYAQEHGIYEITDNSTEKSLAKNVSKSKPSNDRGDFYNLTHKLQPTIYLQDNKVKKVYGKSDIKKVTLEDIKSLNLLKNNDSRYNTADLLTIKLTSKTELSRQIDLTKLSGFSNLKYVFIKCMFKCNAEDIQKVVKVNSNIRLFYISANPS